MKWKGRYRKGGEHSRRIKYSKKSARRIGLTVFTCTLACVSLSGCGEEVPVMNESIELHEPGIGTVATERAAFRDLYDADVYEGAVYPYIEEYSFETGQIFGSYVALPGDRVQKGDVLFTADGEVLSEKIREIEEQLEELNREHEKYVERKEEDLYSKRQELERVKQILNNLEAGKPGETVSDGAGGETANPKYAEWQSEYHKWYGEYSLIDHYITVGEYDLLKNQELYELDFGYYNGLLGELKKEKRKETVVSGISGEVMAMAQYISGEYIPQGVAVMAVGNREELFVKCGYVSRMAVEKAADVYALIGGKRYEVTYWEDSSPGSPAFTFRDEEGTVAAGDYAVLVVMSDYRENVLTVPADAIYNEGTDRLVYVREGGGTVSRKVQTGMSDGVYTEVLSGLEEGDQVLARVQEAGAKTDILERKDVKTQYRAAGYLYLPLTVPLKNSVKNGTVRLVEYQVMEASYVEKGDVIASIQVEGDYAELARMEREVQRAKERLEELEAELDMGREENVDLIAVKQEDIRRQEKELRRIRSDYAATEICAQISGYVGGLAYHSPGDVIEPEEILGYIVEERASYLSLAASNGSLDYGSVVEITYLAEDGQEHTAEGTVLTVGSFGLSRDLVSNMILVGLPQEMQENMQATERRMYTLSFRSLPVTGVLREADDVIAVPVDAVTLRNGRTYVNVLEEDGSVMPRGFLAGGKNGEYYWVIGGLTEGMKICWE